MAKTPVDDAIIVEHIAKLLSGADEPTAAVGAPSAAADDEIELVGATEDAADVEGERDASPLTPHDAAVNAWSARFGALGVKLSAALSALCTNQDDIEAAEEPLRALALLLEKAPVAEDQLCMLTDMQLSQVAKLLPVGRRYRAPSYRRSSQLDEESVRRWPRALALRVGAVPRARPGALACCV